MPRATLYSSKCAAGGHRGCMYLLASSKKGQIWCACGCHWGSIQDQLRRDRAARELFPDLEAVSTPASGVSPVSQPAVAVAVDTQSAAAELEGDELAPDLAD